MDLTNSSDQSNTVSQTGLNNQQAQPPQTPVNSVETRHQEYLAHTSAIPSPAVATQPATDLTQNPVNTASSGTVPPQPPSTLNSDQSDQSSSSSHKPNMLILSLVLVFVGLLTGISMYATGFFRGNNLRMGESIAKDPQASLTKMQDNLVIATDATYPPMEHKDEAGNLIGFDIDLASEIGQELGVKIEFKDMPFDQLFNALDSNSVDLVMSSVTITDERKEKYLFSEPYINAGQVIVSARSSAAAQLTTADLSGKRIGVQKGTTSEEEALKYTSQNLVSSYGEYSQAVDALNSKKIDVIIVDLTAAKGLVDENPTLQISSDPFTNEYYGAVFRKSDMKLKSDVDKAITSLQKRGLLNNIKQKWFQ